MKQSLFTDCSLCRPMHLPAEPQRRAALTLLGHRVRQKQVASQWLSPIATAWAALVLWSADFGLYARRNAPVLLRLRLDGRPE